MISIKKTVGIDEAKKYYGITQQDIANAIGSTQPYVATLKKNENDLDLHLSLRVNIDSFIVDVVKTGKAKKVKLKK